MGIYALKVWAGSIFFGSIIFSIAESLKRENLDSDLIGFILLVILFGFYFSIPAYLLFWIFAFILQFYVKGRWIRRIIFSLLIPLMIAFTHRVLLKGKTLLVDWDFWTDPLIYSYVISGIAMIWLASLPQKP